RPGLTPAQVKELLIASAAPVPGGAVLDLERALATSPRIASEPQEETPAGGSLDAVTAPAAGQAEGVVHPGVAAAWPGDDAITGLVTAWNQAAPATGSFDGNTWSATTWSGNTWSGNTWSTGAWG